MEEEEFLTDNEDVLDGKQIQKQDLVPEEPSLPVAESEITVDSRIKDLLLNSGKIAIITDLDGTIVPYCLNPRECKVDALAHKSLAEMQQDGAVIFVETGRSGADASRLLNLPHAIIVGTAGWEVFVAGENPGEGESIVHERFLEHQDEINHFFELFEQSFLSLLQEQIERAGDDDITEEIVSSDGLLIYEKKAVNKDFARGISLNFNLNQISSQKWETLIEAAEEIYNSQLPESLKEIYRFTKTLKKEGERPNCSFSISPFGEEGKDKGFIQLLRNDDDSNSLTGNDLRDKHFQGLPGGFDGAIFLGDTNQDAKAMRAAHLAAVIAKKRSLSIVVKRQDQSGQEKAMQKADIEVQDVEGAAGLLAGMAGILGRKTTSKGEDENDI